MLKRYALCLVFVLILGLAVSCSGGNGNVATPLTDDHAQVAVESGNTSIIGFWQVVIDKEAGTIDAVGLREGDLILNVLGFLEPPALVGMTIDFGTLVIGTDTVSVDVKLTHPIPDPVFMGFDVRGVVFGPEVTNADGLTIIPSPEFFTGTPFGYQDGLLGAPATAGNYTGLAGYKYFCDGLGLNDDLAAFMGNETNLADRGVFSESPTYHSRHYELDWANVPQNLLVFNYAVYANYNWPVGDAPIEIDDFDITTANSAEAFCAKVTELSSSLYYSGGTGGGAISLMVEVWDWQGNVADVTVEAAGVIPQTAYDVISGPGTSKSTNYDFYDVAATPTATGDLDIIITVTDPVTFGAAWFLDLLPASNSMYDDPVYNCFVYTAEVIECPPATVTSIDPDGCWGGMIDDATITGSFIEGPALAVKLTMSGESDVDCTDVTFVNATTITCDIDGTGMVTGDWTVVVTNGCGVDGELVDGFAIKGCGSLTCPSGTTTYHIATARLYNYNNEPTRAAATPRYIVPYSGSNTMCVIDGPSTAQYFPTTFSYTIYNIAVTTTDRVYFNDSGDSTRIWYLDYDESLGFLNYRTTWGNALPSGWYVHRLMVDDEDNPVVLARGSSSNQMRVYHWTGSDWDSGLDVPASIITECANSYSYAFDYDYDPSTGYNYIVDYYGTIGVWAFDSTGVVWYDNDIWNGISGTSYQPGIFIDKGSPDCRLILMAGYNTSGQTTYWARFNNGGGQKTTGTTVGSSTTFGMFWGRGGVQVNGSTARFVGATYGGNVWGTAIIPNW